MVASGVLERNAGENAAPKKMARSRSTRRDARTATRRVASERAPRQRGGERWRTFAPSTNGGEPNVLVFDVGSRVNQYPAFPHDITHRSIFLEGWVAPG